MELKQYSHKLILIDANSLIHRCYHALPPFTNKKGEPTGALYGVASILLKLSKEQSSEYAAAFFDRPEPTFRKKLYDDYKIQRPKAPDELIFQLKKAHELFEVFGIKTFEIPGFEADDLIGTTANKFKDEPDTQTMIFTGDLDDLQLVYNNKVVVNFLRKGITDTVIYDEEGVKEKYGILPNQLIDYKGLVGDKSDNIPGAKGIGPKTASTIIQKYDNLDNFFETGQKEKAYEKITEQKEVVLLSRELAKINLESPLEIKEINDLKITPQDKIKITLLFEELGFESLIKRATQTTLI